jgi:hypothetical protein
MLHTARSDEVEYILSTFKGIHARNPLFEESASTAEHILATYDVLSRGA